MGINGNQILGPSVSKLHSSFLCFKEVIIEKVELFATKNISRMNKQKIIF